MAENINKKKDTIPFEENLKKALTEMIMLYLLAEKDCYIGELADAIRERSGEALSIVFPYGAVYRMLNSGYILEVPKQKAPDGRKRQYYQITDQGRVHLAHLLEIYDRFFQGVSAILEPRQ